MANKTLQQIANSVARKCGHGRATSIKFSEDVAIPCVTAHVQYGHRKYTTGQYVPNTYLNHFGWKNTYYQAAETEVTFPLEFSIWADTLNPEVLG